MACLTTLGIIPARGGSKRLPRKNLRLLGNKPLVAWAIEAARRAMRISRLVVSSDDDEVLAIAAAYDVNLPLRRPAEISADTSLAIDYVRHALDQLEAGGASRFEAVAIVQPSSPFTLAGDIDATLELLESSPADSVVTVMKLDHAIHPAKLKVLRDDRLLPYLEDERGRMASHQLPEVYVRNCSVYATRRETIDRGQVIGDDCRAHVMPRCRSLDINDEMDLALAEFLLGREAQS